MAIILIAGFCMGFMLAGFVGTVIIVYAAIHQARSRPWPWLCGALICFALSAWTRYESLQLSLASKASGLSMFVSYEKYYHSVQFWGAMFGFGTAGALAAIWAVALMLSRVLNRQSRPSSQFPSPPPEPRD